MSAERVRGHVAITRHLGEGNSAADEQYNAMGTSDFIAGLMERHEKQAWLLRAHIEERG